MKLHCIDIETLDAYIDGRLSDKERYQTEKHLANCDICMEELILAEILMNDSELTEYDPGPGDIVGAALRKIRETVLKISDWLTDLAQPEWIPAYSPSPVRSSGGVSAAIESILIRKDIDELRTEMYIEKADDGNARIWINVFKDNETAENVILTILKDGHTPFARIQKHDPVQFGNQPFGNYSLTLEGVSPDTKERFETAPYHFEINSAGFYEK